MCACIKIVSVNGTSVTQTDETNKGLDSQMFAKVYNHIYL